MKKRLCALLAAFLLLAGCSLPQGGGAGDEESAPAPESASSSGASSGGASSGDTSSASKRLAKYKKPSTAADVFHSIDYERGKNSDTVGWLAILDTAVNNSVLQAHDNNYYLRRTERGAEDVYGCYFADYECSFGPRDSLSPNTVVYGHSDLKDDPEGPRFSQLFHFTDETFARAHPVIEFSTIYDYMKWEIFAVFYSEANWSGGNYNAVNLSDAQLAALIADARERSLYDYGVSFAETGEKILTLSTCTVEYGQRQDQRFVVMARLLPADAADPQTASLAANPDPKQPLF